MSDGARSLSYLPGEVTQARRTGRFVALDGLRIVAAGLVFLRHALPDPFVGGFLGVDIFFVISGFVITHVLVVDGFRLRRFYVHRLLRIFPPMLPVIGFCLVAQTIYPGIIVPADAVYAIASVMNWAMAFGATTGNALSHFWSLSLEEQFYAVWPIALATFARSRNIVSRIAIAVGLLTVWQFWQGAIAPPWPRVYTGLDTRAAQILLGSLVYFVRFEGPLPQWLLVAPLGLFGVALLTVDVRTQFYETVGIPLAGICAAMMVAQLTAGSTSLHRLFHASPIQWGARRSYAIYLWHMPIIAVSFRVLPTHGAWIFGTVAAALVATLVCAELSWRLVEAPASRWRAWADVRWFDRQSVREGG